MNYLFPVIRVTVIYLRDFTVIAGLQIFISWVKTTLTHEKIIKKS